MNHQLVSHITFLGTSSATPLPGKRNVSSLAITTTQGNVFIVDCGEGTQHQIKLCNSVKMSKINHIFLTHLHGDHCYGIFGLLASIGLNGRTSEMTVYGPVGVKNMVETVRQASGGSPYGINYVELQGDQCVDLGLIEGFHVWGCPLEHRVPTYGYVFEEPQKPGSLDGKKAMGLGARGKQLGQLKDGQDVILEDGTTIRSEDCLGEPQPGLKVVILQDTCGSPSAVDLSKNCALLIHECTYHEALREKAIDFGHSTTVMAAEYAKSVDAKMLALTHFSSRYCESSSNEKEPQQQEEEEQKICEEIGAAEFDADLRGDADMRVVDLLSEAQECCKDIKVVAAEDFMTIRRTKKGFVVEGALSRKNTETKMLIC